MPTIRHINEEEYAAKALELLNHRREGYVNYALSLLKQSMSPGQASEKLEDKVKEIQQGCEKGYFINPQYKGSSLHQLLNCAALLALMDKVSPNESYASCVSGYLNYVMGTNAQSRNAFPEMVFEHREQSLEVSSALLLAIQGIGK